MENVITSPSSLLTTRLPLFRSEKSSKFKNILIKILKIREIDYGAKKEKENKSK